MSIERGRVTVSPRYAKPSHSFIFRLFRWTLYHISCCLRGQPGKSSSLRSAPALHAYPAAPSYNCWTKMRASSPTNLQPGIMVRHSGMRSGGEPLSSPPHSWRTCSAVQPTVYILHLSRLFKRPLRTLLIIFPKYQKRDGHHPPIPGHQGPRSRLRVSLCHPRLLGRRPPNEMKN